MAGSLRSRRRERTLFGTASETRTASGLDWRWRLSMDNGTARRLAKHPRWRWLPGMLAKRDPEYGGSDHPMDIARVVDVDEYGEAMWCTMGGDVCHGYDGTPHLPPGLALPDLDDASTVRMLWALACEACDTDTERWMFGERSDIGAFVAEVDTVDGSHRTTGGMPLPDALLTLWEWVDAADKGEGNG